MMYTTEGIQRKLNALSTRTHFSSVGCVGVCSIRIFTTYGMSLFSTLVSHLAVRLGTRGNLHKRHSLYEVFYP